MEAQLNKINNGTGYLKNIVLLISKDGNTYTGKVSISSYKNNELEIKIIGVEDKRNNILFDSNVEIITIFNFGSINEDLLGLLLLISGIKKFSPKSINLVLPYFPYTTKDMELYNNEENVVKISTDNGLFTLLQDSGISTIKTFDLGNLYVKNYSSIYIENISKEQIFIDEFDFFKKTTKELNILLLNTDDYLLFDNIFGKKDNINLIYINPDILKKGKKEQLHLLKQISDNGRLIIYIFDKGIVKGNNIHNLMSLLVENLTIKELNLCITHGIFAQGSYRKYNNFIEKYPFFNITTTNSILGYGNKLVKDKSSIIKLPFISKEKKAEIKKTEESENENEN